MTILHVNNLGFLHGTQSRTADKPHNKKDNRRVPEVNEQKAMLVCGHEVEIRPWSGPGQLLALAASDLQVVKDLSSIW